MAVADEVGRERLERGKALNQPLSSASVLQSQDRQKHVAVWRSCNFSITLGERLTIRWKIRTYVKQSPVHPGLLRSYAVLT